MLSFYYPAAIIASSKTHYGIRRLKIMRLIVSNSNHELKAELTNTFQIRSIFKFADFEMKKEFIDDIEVETFHFDGDYQIYANTKDLKVFLLKKDIFYFVDDNLKPINAPYNVY